MENVCILYGHLEYLTAIRYMLRPISNLVVIWYIFPRFGILYREKSGNPSSDLACFPFSKDSIPKKNAKRGTVVKLPFGFIWLVNQSYRIKHEIRSQS
jgi:hypothetical protein